MTLIDYVNRVHFADNVLEEAVWAEVDRRGRIGVCLISDDDHANGELGERVRAALPRRTPRTQMVAAGSYPAEAEASAIADACRTAGCDLLLAYGSGEVINLAKAARLILAGDAPLDRYAEDEGGSLRISGPLPDLIALPALRGFCAGFNGLLSVQLDDGRMIDIASRELTPTVTIADPTATARETPQTRAAAGVAAITICVEALLSQFYNPPASGIALDGLNRTRHALHPAVETDAIAARRELMAGCMDAAIIGEQGLGPVHAIASALCAVAPDRRLACSVDKGAVRRLVLPEIVAFHAAVAPVECAALAGALGSRTAEIADRLAAMLDELPLPASLGALGFERRHLVSAAEIAMRHRAIGNGPCRPDADTIRNILDSML